MANCVRPAIGLIALAIAGEAPGGVLSGPVINDGLTVAVIDLHQLPFTLNSRPYARVNALREAPDGSGRLFVADLNGPLYAISGGQIQLYMDLDVLIPAMNPAKTNAKSSLGFVSFALHPDFATNGLFYTNHTESVGSTPANLGPAFGTTIVQHSVLTEWQATNPAANSFSGTSRELMRIAAPTPFHPLGEIAFNPTAQPGDDDYGLLYLAGGDYGTGTTGQPHQIQRLDTPLGTVMRIDPLGGPFQRDGITYFYGIPATNPYANDGDPSTLGEIYAHGFRNGHRISWDTITGTAFLSDVGQGNIEEVNILAPGANYGWPEREGTFALDVDVDNETVFPLPANDASFGYTYPAAQYDHAEGFAIAGGFVYRGTAIPALQGRFVFGDIVTGRMFYANVDDLLAADDGDPATTAPVYELNLVHDDVSKSLLQIIRDALGDPTVGRTDLRFGVDQAGEIYITSKQDAFIRKLTGFATDEYKDDFNRAALGSNWVVDRLSFAISGDELVETAPRTFAPAQMRWQGGSAGGSTNTPDQFAKIEIRPPLTSTPAGFIVRANAPSGPLGAHYELHFKVNSGTWRWEYYNPLWQATLGSCVGDGALAALDWIGVKLTGSGPDTEVSFYRWDADPDGGGPSLPDVNWGPADCVLQSASGPYADTGQFGGIRFYGADSAQSRADNWSFGSLATGAPQGGDALRGGLLWDRWWVVNGAAEPSGDHPLYPPVGQQQGSATFRCKECHGWDYKGVDGAYGAGSHFTGIPGVFGSALTPAEAFDLIKTNAVPNGHDFESYGLSDQDIGDLVEFLQTQMIDTDLFIDSSAQFIGDALQGQSDYTSGNCTYCHGDDGTAINFGTPQDPVWVGTLAVDNPWEFFHKVRFGDPGSSMPSWIGDGGDDQGVADIGLYAQSSLPIDCLSDLDCDDGAFCNGAESCVAGVCEAGAPACVDLAHCDEAADVCLECVADAECDDGIFCNGAESCSAGSCAPGGDPCPGASCDEGADICLASCGVDADCDDGAFCNGAETCDAGTCAAGVPSCVDLAHCDEAADVCLECVADAECDDGAFCNGSETCDAGSCAAGVLSCVDLAHCDEGADVCLECVADAECDDGVFCNGAETCEAGACAAGADPCPGEICEEASLTCTPATFTQYTDDFDRASLGPDWVIDNLSFAIEGNELTETSPRTLAPAQMRWRGGAAAGDTGTPDQYGKIQIRSPLTTTPAGFIARANDPSQPLGAHYEIHFNPSSAAWRWEYYNPLWQATLGSCPGDGPLAALDWIGFAISGSGVGTEVALYRWSSDPDAGGPADPAVAWGPPDCVLQPSAGPFADDGRYGGIRFYGSDSRNSRADNWTFGGLGAAPGCIGDAECDDGSFCNGAETCVAGACTAGVDPCPGGSCDEAGDVCIGGCGSDAECDDGSFCNGAEICNAGSCEAGAPACVDPAHCDEGADVCLECIADAECDDGAFCNGSETCDAGACSAGAASCVDLAHCDEGADACLECIADAECDDGAFCNGAETCSAGACAAGVLSCVDVAHCDEGADVCLECIADVECDDGAFCNGAETCEAGACALGSDPCPGETCDEAGLTCAFTASVEYTDDFNRASLGPDWVIDRLSFAIESNELAETSPRTFAPAQMRWRGGGAGGDTGTPDQYGKIQIRSPLTTTPAGFIVRANDPGQPLGAHYELHFKVSSAQWRWEYYNPLWQATLGECPGDAPLAALDWIGFAISGSGLDTEVSFYRWSSDPDAGGPADPVVAWGPPECVLQPSAGPFADDGRYGGIRFYGNDTRNSRADNWTFGGIGAPLLPPDDPFFPQLWALHNEGQTGGSDDADIDALEAWVATTGSPNVVVALLDTGVDYDHPDLAANIWTNAGEIPGNGIDDDANGYVDDTRGWDFYNDDNDPFDDGGHGTHLAGIIGAVGNNGIGVAGVNHSVRIMPLKIMSGGQAGTVDAAIEAIQYATAMGAHVMSNSWAASAAWGEPGWDQPGFAPALQAAIEQANAAGILFAATAGNATNDRDQFPLFPGSYDNDNIVNVTATDASDALAPLSSYGPTSVDLAAPGVGIVSTVPATCNLLGPPPGGGACDGSGYLLASGTSQATAYVAGVAALVHARFPGISLAELRDRLLYSVDVLPDLVGITVSEGRVNAASAREYDPVAPAAIGDLAVVAATSSSLTLGFTATGDNGTLGTARAYEIRFSTAPIDAGNFESAAPVATPPRPLPAGSPELIEIVGLDAATSYHFAVRAIDNVGNRGAVVDDAMGTTNP